MTLQELVSQVAAYTICENVYIDLDGTIRPHKFPRKGMWRFDGQFFYLLKPGHYMNGEHLDG